MKLGLRLTIIFISVNLFAMFFASVFIIESFQTELKNTILKQGEFLVNTKHLSLEDAVNTHKSELLLLSKSEFMKKYSKNSSDEFKMDIIDLAKTIMFSDSSVSQIRFIDSNGNEKIVLNQIDGNIKIVEKYQNKSDRDYFQKSIFLDNGEIYLSSISLNEEFGKVSVPHNPVFRLATPIFSENILNGILIFNISANEILENLSVVDTGDMILFDQNGQFILHPNKSVLFSNQLGTNYSYFYEQPEIQLNLQKQISKIHDDVEDKEIRIWKKLFFDSTNQDVYWVLLNKISKEEMFSTISVLLIQSLFIIILSTLAILILTFFISNKFSKQIQRLRDFSEGFRIGKFGQIEISGDDEIKELSTSLNKTSDDLLNLTDIKSQLQLKKNLENALDESSIVSITDSDGVIKHVNEYFCKISKFSEEELIGKNHRILKSGNHSNKFYTNMWKTISSGNVWHGEIQSRSKDGSLYWADTTIVPFFDKTGKITEYVAIRNDITSQKDLSQQLIKSERFSAIGQLSARFAHDVRNPLSVITLGIEFLKDRKLLTQEYQDTLKLIEKSADRIGNQIEQMLDFARVSKLKTSKSLLDGILDDAIDISDIPQSVKVSRKNTNKKIFCDSEKMVIVFMNLFTNAISEMKNKGEITINLESQDHTWIISIQNSGPSIPTENLNNIFEPLFTTKQKGTGLGLATCKNIVEDHQGKIYAVNNPTTFVIILPKNKKEN